VAGLIEGTGVNHRKDGKSFTAVVLEEDGPDGLQAGRPQDAVTIEKAVEMNKRAVAEAPPGCTFG
jgi:hypothetical protein